MSDKDWVITDFEGNDTCTATAQQSHNAADDNEWHLVDAATAEETNSADMGNSDLPQKAGLAIGAELTPNQEAGEIDELVAELLQKSSNNIPPSQSGCRPNLFDQKTNNSRLTGNKKKQRKHKKQEKKVRAIKDAEVKRKAQEEHEWRLKMKFALLHGIILHKVYPPHASQTLEQNNPTTQISSTRQDMNYTGPLNINNTAPLDINNTAPLDMDNPSRHLGPV